MIGDVTLERDVSVWYAAVLRGDVERIRVGERSNVQDGAVLHVTMGRFSCEVGAEVTIGANERDVEPGQKIRRCALRGRLDYDLSALSPEDVKTIEDFCISAIQ